jgi:hypothetical protein
MSKIMEEGTQTASLTAYRLPGLVETYNEESDDTGRDGSAEASFTPEL